MGFLLVASSAHAQTPSFKLGWNQTLGASETFASLASYQWTLKIDANAATVVTATCVNGTPPSCTAPLPAMTPGTHTLVLTAFNGFGSAASAPFTGGPPQTPVIVSVTVTVTIP